MSDAQKIIANVLLKHRFNWSAGGTRCIGGTCDWKHGYQQQHAAHVAAEIDKALGGLAAEERTNPMSSSGMTTNYNTGEVISFSDIRRDVRWVSGWSEVRS